MNEFSIPLSLDDVPPSGTEMRFEANEQQRAALAKRFNIIELNSLRGVAKVKSWRKVGLALEGHFTAELVQACVVTLEPVPEKLDESFKLYFLPEEMIGGSAAPGSEREIVIDVVSEEPPEALENGGIDVGEAVAEQLSLAMDPYPKKAGVVFEPPAEGADEAGARPANPFAALEKLKKKD
ncbi:MAG TPA: DUF177 domain-containing protein [Parvibaculum sp.]